MSEWTEFDELRANSEGWCIANDPNGQLVIQKLDGSIEFDTDRGAITYVYMRAVEGSPLHRKALLQTATHGRSATDDYHVSWEINVDATSPEAAAEQAEALMLDPARIGNIFKVRLSNDDTIPAMLVELKDGKGHIVTRARE